MLAVQHGTPTLNLGIYKVASDIWPEYTVNYNTQPAYGALITSQGFTNTSSYPATYTEIDVTSYVNDELAQNKIVSFAFRSINKTEECLGVIPMTYIWYPFWQGHKKFQVIIVWL